VTALLAVALLAPPVSVRVESIRAPHPPHCIAAGQWRDPIANSPVDLFDSTRWWTVCARAAREGDYAIDVRLAEPVRTDRVRISRPPLRSAKRIEIHFYDSSLSTKVPIYFREIAVGADGGEARLQGPLKWNPNLIDDDGFHARRKAAGHDRYQLDTPLKVDRLTFVLRELEPGEKEPAIGPVTLWLGDRMLPLEDAAGARAEHARWIGTRLSQTLRGQHLQAGLRVLSLDASGIVFETVREAWDAGEHEAARVALGRWRIADGRFEFAAEGGADYAPVEYTIDDAPHEVWLQTRPLTGVYRIVETVPAPKHEPALLGAPPPAAAPAKKAPERVVIPIR
jgi:hypothetical protein